MRLLREIMSREFGRMDVIVPIHRQCHGSGRMHWGTDRRAVLHDGRSEPLAR
jgi:hypothetical protein